MRGAASTTTTERFRRRFASLHPDHFRLLQDCWVSSIGLGTYLGDADDRTDARYAEAIRAAVDRGCNVLDTAINYRCQRSERTIGRAVAELVRTQRCAREDLVLCTKGGYLPFDGDVPADPARYLAETVVTAGLAPYDEIVGGCHCLWPPYLEHAFHASLRNLQLETLDVYYLHNPEQQLDEVPWDVLARRLAAAFSLLERCVREGRLRYYGVATWQGLRAPASAREHLPLEQLVELAQRAAGASHHFRLIQLPYNLAMPEAFVFKNQTVQGEAVTPIEAARRLGLSVVASASLLQSRLARLPAAMEAHLPGLSSSAQRAIQFVRSTPGVTTSLVGMKTPSHVEENLALAAQPLLSPERIETLFDRRRA